MSINTFQKTRDHLATRWQGTDKNLLRHIFPLLAQGRPVSPFQLTKITGKDIATVEQELIKGHTD